MARILAVDWGERRIGLAISDPSGIIATGLKTIEARNREHAIQSVVAAAREAEAERVVVGLPLLMSGEIGSAAVSARSFADALAEQLGLPVDTYDERLTSALSARRMRETGVRTGHNRAKIDQGAAIALLESYLMRLQSRPPEGGS